MTMSDHGSNSTVVVAEIWLHYFFLFCTDSFDFLNRYVIQMSPLTYTVIDKFNLCPTQHKKSYMTMRVIQKVSVLVCLNLFLIVKYFRPWPASFTFSVIITELTKVTSLLCFPIPNKSSIYWHIFCGMKQTCQPSQLWHEFHYQ